MRKLGLKVVCEASCLGGRSRHRGIGIYAQGVLAALGASGAHDFVLLSQASMGEGPIPRVLRYPVASLGCEEGEAWKSAVEFERLLHEEQADLLHFLSPFEDVRLPLGVRSCPRMATVYDLIPLIFREQYAGGQPAVARSEFWSRYERLEEFDHLIAISEATKADVMKHLGISGDRISVAPPDCGERFRPGVSAEEIQEALLETGLRQPFFVYTAGIDHRKNLEGLLGAFALSESRHSLHLAVVCAISADERRRLEETASALGVGDRVRFTGYISLRQLVALYNAARFSVFPSLYEGFGLPVLESLRCACPVIASNTSSLPEILGDAGILVDPTDSAALAAAIDRLGNDAIERERLRVRGIERAARFSWARSAATVEAAYERVSRRSPRGRRSGERVAFFSPLLPLRSGVARYSFELLGELAQRFSIDVFVDQPLDKIPRLPDPIRPIDHRRFPDLARDERYRCVIYQLGNSEFHTYLLPWLFRVPGLTVLHDLTLHDLIWYLNLKSGNRLLDPYRDLVNRLYDREGRTLATVAAHGFSIEPLKGRFTLLEPFVTASRAVLVHNCFAQRCIQTAFPDTQVFHSPVWSFQSHFVPISPEERVVLGLPARSTIIGCFGHLAESKRVEPLLHALRRLIRCGIDVHGLFVGEEMPWKHWSTTARKLGLGRQVTFTGPVSDRQWDILLSATDVVVALRYPTRGETSAPLVSALGMGKPCLVSNYGSARDLPEGTCVRVTIGRSEEDDLVAVLERLVRDPEWRSRLGACGQEYAREYLSVKHAADIYSSAIERLSGSKLATTVA